MSKDNTIKQAKILIVEDEPEINRLIELVLQQEGYYKIKKAYNGQEAYKIIEDYRPHLILLDIMLPKIDGFELLKKVREDDNLKTTEIIMLTARKMEEDVLKSFEYGAVDYISKPFSNKILLARIKNRLQNLKIEGKYYNYKEISINDEKKTVKVNDEIIDLTNFEYRILVNFIQNQGIVFSRTQLLSLLRGDEGFNISERAVDVQIVNLRKKLKQHGQYIETIRGVGYKLKES